MKFLLPLGIMAVITACATVGVKIAKEVMQEDDYWKESIRPDVAAYLTNPNSDE